MFHQEIMGQDDKGNNLHLSFPGVTNWTISSYESGNGPGASTKAIDAVLSIYNITGLCLWSYSNDEGFTTKLTGPNGFISSQSSSTLNSEVFNGIKTSNAATSSVSQQGDNLRIVMRNYPGYGIVLFFENNYETQISPQALRIEVSANPDDKGNATYTFSRVAKSSIPNFSTGYTYQLNSEWMKSYWINTYQNTQEWQAPILIRDSNGYYILKVISEPLADSTYTTGFTLIPIANSKNFDATRGFIGINGVWFYKTKDSSLEQIKTEMSGMSNKYISR